MELADYSTADITRTYYYTLLQDAYTSEEYIAKNKQKLEAAIKTGKVFTKLYTKYSPFYSNYTPIM